MKRSAQLYIDDMIKSLEKIERYIKGLSFDKARQDTKTIDAVVRNLEIIGEAASRIPKEIKDKYPELPWKEMVGMRNKVIHEYFGVDVTILWKTVKEDLPPLKKEIKKIRA